MTETALKKTILTTQVMPAAPLSSSVILTSKAQMTFSNTLIKRVSRKARNSEFSLS